MITDIINAVKQEPIVGIGLGSFGTQEYVNFQYNVLTEIDENIAILVEVDYFQMKFFSELDSGLSKGEVYSAITKSNLPDFYKSHDYKMIFYHCYKHQIPVTGFLVNKSRSTKHMSKFEKKLVKYFLKDKQHKIHKKILKQYLEKYGDDRKIVYLAHNVTIQKPNFIGLSIATYSPRGTIAIKNTVDWFDFRDMKTSLTTHIPVFNEDGNWMFVPHESFDFLVHFVETNFLSFSKKSKHNSIYDSS